MITRRFKEGDFQQFPHLWILYGKIMSFSFSILEAVQRAIDKEPLILVTNTNIPFLENACCNEGNPNTNEYFSDKESSIQKHNKIIYTLTELYYRFKNSIKSALLNIDKNTKITFPPVNNTFSTSTVYLAFIKFCKFNSGIILDEDLQSVCIRNNCDFRIPVSDDFNEQLSEKIETMRSNGLTYSVESLNILLNIINRKNIIPIDLDPPVITEKLFLERTLEYLETKADTFICPSDMIKHLKNIVDRFDVSISPKEEDTIFEDFERYLNRINDEQSKIMVEQLVETGIINKKLQDIIILYTHKSKISKSRQSKFILNWNPRGDNMYMTQNDETGFAIFRFLKQMVINICKIYPNIILNEVKYKDRYVPKHWITGSRKFSIKHKQDLVKIMEKDLEDFSTFYGDKKLKPVLHNVIKKSDDLLLLLESIPFYAGLLGGEKAESIFDGDIIKNLGYYFLICALNLYISSSEEVYQEIPAYGDDEEGDDDDTLEQVIIQGRRETLDKKIAALLSVYIKKLETYKTQLNYSSEEINKKVLKSKEKEKSKITLRLGQLTVEEREIENILKNQSLGDWGVGQTKAIFEYDARQYDKERAEQEKDDLLDIQRGLNSGIDESDAVSKTDIEWANAVEARINREINDLSALPEDDDYGQNDAVDYA